MKIVTLIISPDKKTHGLVFGGPLRLGALGPGPPGPLVKTALTVEDCNLALFPSLLLYYVGLVIDSCVIGE